MARIEPIPYDELPDEARRRIEAGMETGMYSTPFPLQIVAHSPVALRGMDESYKAHFGQLAIGTRLEELLRLRSAQINQCIPCSSSRKDDSISEEDVDGLCATDNGSYTARERLALRFMETFATDPDAIDDDRLRELAEEFSIEEIVELGWLCGQFIGGHRFMHVLDILGDAEPVLRRPVTAS